MSAIVVGGLLAAVTSLPNAVAAVYLASRGRGAATLSEAFNSNACNVTVGLLVPGAILGLAHPSSDATFVALPSRAVSGGGAGTSLTTSAHAAPLILFASNQSAVHDRATLEHAALEAEESDKKNDDLKARLERIEGMLAALTAAKG